jgi:hypothetical protein
MIGCNKKSSSSPSGEFFFFRHAYRRAGSLVCAPSFPEFVDAQLEPQFLGHQDLPALNLYARNSESSQWSAATAGTTMNDPLDSHMQSMCGVEAPLHFTITIPCGNIENPDPNQDLPSDRGHTNEASDSLAKSR